VRVRGVERGVDVDRDRDLSPDSDLQLLGGVTNRGLGPSSSSSSSSSVRSMARLPSAVRMNLNGRWRLLGELVAVAGSSSLLGSCLMGRPGSGLMRGTPWGRGVVRTGVRDLSEGLEMMVTYSHFRMLL